MIIQRGQANDHQEGPVSCKWSPGGTGLSQMIIWKDQPLANDHLEGPASCKWIFGGTGLLPMVIWMDRSLPNDHPDQPDFSPFIFVFFSKIPIFLQHTTSSPSKNFLFKSFKLQSRGPFMLILRQIHNNFYNNYKNYEWSQMYIFDKAWVLFTSKYRFEEEEASINFS